MACRLVGNMIVCGPRPKPKRCRHCNNPATSLCDFKLLVDVTCDTPICRKCAFHINPDTDLCPAHWPAGEPVEGSCT